MIILKVEDTFQWGEGVPRREEQQPTHIVRQRHERSTTRWDPTLMPSSNIKEVLHDYHPHLFLLAVVNCGAPAPKAGWDYTNCAHSWDLRLTATHQGSVKYLGGLQPSNISRKGFRQIFGGSTAPKYLTDGVASNIWGVYSPKIFDGTPSVKYLGGLHPQYI